MSRQRWGAFSVKDHIDAAALAADVLLYDKLRFPVPPKEDEVRWEDAHRRHSRFVALREDKKAKDVKTE
jgi:hypothetical protein